MANFKPGSVLINVSRGGLVVQTDLLKLLEQGHIWAAGLDVLETEPLETDNALFRNHQLVITPHIAGGSPLRASRLVEQFCENLKRWNSGDELIGRYDSNLGF